MSTVQQYFSDWNMFDEIKKLHQDYSIETFIDNDTLNKLWIFKSGNKILNPIIDTMDKNDVAKIVSGLCYKKWKRIATNLSRDIQVESYKENYSENSNVANENKVTSNNTTNHNVSCYNEDSLEPKDENVTNLSTVDNKNYTGNKTYEKTVTRGDDLKNIEYAIKFLKNNNLCDIIISDVDNVLCLKIYDTEV